MKNRKLIRFRGSCILYFPARLAEKKIITFSYPDYTVGPGIYTSVDVSPDPASDETLAGFTAGRELLSVSAAHPAPKVFLFMVGNEHYTILKYPRQLRQNFCEPR
jgi:hypothetical protein